MENNHNCNLCKYARYVNQYGNICFGKKNWGKIIEHNDEICEEYEFGGFIELSERLSKIGEQVKELREISEIYEDMDGGELLKEAANTIELLYKKQSDSAWIPCKDKLPEEKINPITNDFYEYQVTYKNGDVTDIRHYKFGDNHWWNSGQNMDKYVIAWQPLPEPYKPNND